MKHIILLLFFLTLSSDVISQKLYYRKDLAKLNIKLRKVDGGTLDPSRHQLFQNWYNYEITITDIEGRDHVLPKYYYLHENDESMKQVVMYFDETKYYIAVSSFFYERNNSQAFYIELITLENDKFKSENLLNNVGFNSSSLTFGKKTGPSDKNKQRPSLYFSKLGDEYSNDDHGRCYLSENGVWKSENLKIDKNIFFYISRMYENSSQNYIWNEEYYPFEISEEGKQLSYERIGSPYYPVYCEGDDMTNAPALDPSDLRRKELIKHKELIEHRIEIPYMPAVQYQFYGTCLPYTYAGLYQHFLNNKYQEKIVNGSLPDSLQVSYFGMMLNIFNAKQDDSSFVAEFLNKNLESERYLGVFNNKYFAENGLVMGNCRNIQKMLDYINYGDGSISTHIEGGTNPAWLKEMEVKGQALIDFINTTYATYKFKTLTKSELKLIKKKFEEVTTLNANDFDFEASLKQQNESLYFKSLFFDGCIYRKIDTDLISYKLEKSGEFNSIDFTIDFIKNTLKCFKSPIGIAGQLTNEYINIKGEYMNTHKYKINNKNVVNHICIISGFKQVMDPSTGKVIDLFKIHNSWGDLWQRQNNNGWVDARRFIFRHPMQRGLLRDLEISFITNKKPLKLNDYSTFKSFSETLTEKCSTAGLQKAKEFYNSKSNEVNLNIIFKNIEKYIIIKQWSKALELCELYEYLMPSDLRLPFLSQYTLPYVYKINFLMGYINSKLGKPTESTQNYKLALNALNNPSFNINNFYENNVFKAFPERYSESDFNKLLLGSLKNELEYFISNKKSGFRGTYKEAVLNYQMEYDENPKKNIDVLYTLVEEMVFLLEHENSIDYIEKLLEYEKILTIEMNNPSSLIKKENWASIYKNLFKLNERLGYFDPNKLENSLYYVNKYINEVENKDAEEKANAILQKAAVLYKMQKYNELSLFLKSKNNQFINKYSTFPRRKNFNVYLYKYYLGMSYFHLNEKLKAAKELYPAYWAIYEIFVNKENDNYYGITEFSKVDLEKTLENCPQSAAGQLIKRINEISIDAAITEIKNARTGSKNYFELEEFNILPKIVYRFNRSVRLKIAKLNIELFSDSFIVFDTYANELEKNGNVKEAIEMYKKSLALNPENELVKNKLESLLKE